MNENLDLTKILEGCPKGTKFYSSVYGEVSFEGIRDISIIYEYPIKLKAYNKYTDSTADIYYEKDGICVSAYDGECTLFPSRDQRDWAKFERFWDRKVKRFDPKTLKPFDKVLVRDEDCYWTTNLFSHSYNGRNSVICCGGYCWKQCIPYNEETKHLVGTTDDCPEFYKWWEEQICWLP